MKTVTLPVKGFNVAGCAREIEKKLGKLEPITQVEASYLSQTVTITYDEARLSEAALRERVQDCGFACGEPRGATPRPESGTLGGGMYIPPATMPGQAGHHAAHTREQATPPGSASAPPAPPELNRQAADRAATPEHQERAEAHPMPEHAGMSQEMMPE